MPDEAGDPLAPDALLRDVLAIVSHDLRTPLSVVHTTASMLLNPKYQLTPAQVREQHERIRRNVDVMNRMIGDLVDMVSLRGGQFSIDLQPVGIDEVLREAVAAHEAPARDKGVALSFESGADVVKTQADRARLMQVLRKLLGNAVKYCKSGDRISVTCRADGGRAQIEIADTGAGIAPDDLQHLFDPYSSGRKDQKANSGLGLYIANGIVQAHGGQIRCESTPGVGTTFFISLPLAPQ